MFYTKIEYFLKDLNFKFSGFWGFGVLRFLYKYSFLKKLLCIIFILIGLQSFGQPQRIFPRIFLVML